MATLRSAGPPGPQPAALHNIPVNAPDAAAGHAAKGAGFRAWRDPTASVASSLDLSPPQADGAADAAVRRSTGSPGDGTARAQRPKWWSGLTADDLPSPAAGAREPSSPPKERSFGAAPASPASPRTPPRGARAGFRSPGAGGYSPSALGRAPLALHGADAAPVALLPCCSSPVKPGSVHGDLWDESDAVVSDFFGLRTASPPPHPASEVTMGLLLRGLHLGAPRPCPSPAAAGPAATSGPSSARAAAAAAAAASAQARGGVGYANAYRDMRDRGAASAPAAAAGPGAGAGGGPGAAGEGGPGRPGRPPARRTVYVAGLAFSLREDFLSRPPVASMGLPEIQAEKHELKVELKGVDRDFVTRSGRKATKAEKESLRPWYVRYWRLKHAISRQGGAADRDDDM